MQDPDNKVIHHFSKVESINDHSRLTAQQMRQMVAANNFQVQGPMKRLMSIAALGLIATSTLVVNTPAQAQIFGTINNRQSQMQARVNAGVRSGRLTRQEAFNLQRRMRQINFMESQFRNSRGLSFQERARLNGELARLNIDISRQLNDSDTRSNRWGHRRF